MGRRLGFDPERALDRATRLFWSKGYAAASLKDLLHAMEIGESSLYHFVDGKKELYQECLKHYNQSVTTRRFRALQSEPAIGRALRAFFEVIFTDLSQRENPRGCLMTNSLSQEVLQDPTLKRYVFGQMDAFEGYLEGRFRKTVRTGELKPDFPCKTAAQLLVTHLQGVFKMSACNSPNMLRKQTELLLKSLGV